MLDPDTECQLSHRNYNEEERQRELYEEESNLEKEPKEDEDLDKPLTAEQLKWCYRNL